MTTVAESLGVLASVWRSMLLGTGLMLIAMFVGLMLARDREFFPVRAIAWWVKRVIAPLLTWRSWAVRALAIFSNNMLVLTALVALGVWPWAAVAGIACVGVSMGIAIRVLTALPESFAIPGEEQRRLRRRIRAGVLLNMLEPPAIVAALGLSLGREPAHQSGADTWSVFLMLILPAMALAAAGESLWIGAGREAHEAAAAKADAEQE